MAVSERVMLEFLGFLSAELAELHAVEVHRLREAWDKFRTIKQPVTPWKTSTERIRLIESIAPGDIWVQIKSGREVTVLAVEPNKYGRGRSLRLKHENGATTRKWYSYFGAEYTPKVIPDQTVNSESP